MKKLTTSALVAILSFAGTGLAARQQTTGMILERIIVRVNGEILTQTQLVDRQTEAVRERNRGNPNLTDAAIVQQLTAVTPDVLVNAVDEMLIAQHGRELGAKFTDVEFKNALETIKKENNLNDEQLKAAMAQEALTMDQLRNNFERAYMIQAVQSQEVLRRITLTEEELRQYYSGHREELMTPATLTLREITVAVPLQAGAGALTARPEDLAAARAKIDAARARLAAGEDFASVAKATSDSPTKENGGLVGPLNVEDINPTLRTVLDKLRPGELSDIVEMPRGGYQIFKLEERAASVLPPFDTVRPRVEQAVRGNRLDAEMQKVKARLRNQAVIEWKDETLRTQYQRRLAELTAQQ
ncbi:MAG: peptidylprolyl isomerase [Acidobacteria bacterium]|nr:peptidylprolyl isomerase [Acidobacteriota bacterium]